MLKSSLKANSLNKIFMYYFNEKYLFNRATLHVYIEMEQQEKLSTWVIFKQTGFPSFLSSLEEGISPSINICNFLKDHVVQKCK